MPAKDRYHDAVKRALIKDGWTISKEQYKLDVDRRRLWIDLYAEKADQQAAILVEVKSFENLRSPVRELMDITGQYVLYQTALEVADIDLPLYLAIPEKAYQGIFTEKVGQRLIWRIGIKLLLFSLEREEVTRWIP